MLVLAVPGFTLMVGTFFGRVTICKVHGNVTSGAEWYVDHSQMEANTFLLL
jgi:hypothetical protein